MSSPCRSCLAGQSSLQASDSGSSRFTAPDSARTPREADQHSFFPCVSMALGHPRTIPLTDFPLAVACTSCLLYSLSCFSRRSPQSLHAATPIF